MKKFWFITVIFAVLVALWVPDSHATYFKIEDRNSFAEIDTTAGSNNALDFQPFGMFNWNIDGRDYMYEQWFFFRVGDNAEQSISVLPIAATPGPPPVPKEGTFDTNFDFVHDTFTVIYAGPGFEIEVRAGLQGGSVGSNSADIHEEILITNLGTDALDFHLFQYTDFDMSGPPTFLGDTLYLKNANTFVQYNPETLFSETVGTPGPTNYEGALWHSTRDKLTDVNVDDLNNLVGASATGPLTGDVTWAWQWDKIIAGGGSFSISKDKNVRPNEITEPGVLLLLGSGLIGLASFGRLRKKKKRL